MRLVEVIAYPDGEIDGIDPVWRIDSVYHVPGVPIEHCIDVSLCSKEISDSSYIKKVVDELAAMMLALNNASQIDYLVPQIIEFRK